MNARKLKRGSVLLLILIIVLFMMVIGVGVLALSFHGRMASVRAGSEIAARCAADAAVGHAIYRLNQKIKIKPWDESTLDDISALNMELPNCDAAYDYSVSNIGGNYVINTTGRAGNSTRNIEAVLRIQSVFDYALFAKDLLELKNSAFITWVNNQPDDWPMQIGTNSINPGAITLMSTTTINGDVLVGVGGDPNSVIDAKSGVTVTGTQHAMFSKVVFPSVTVPDSLLIAKSEGTLNVPNPKDTRTISISAKYDKIDLRNGKSLIIDEPVTLYITGDVNLGSKSSIVISNTDPDHDASLTIYVGGNFTSNTDSQINNETADARRFTLYGLDSCPSVTIRNGCNFYGAIYAPNAFIDVDNSGNIYGSVIGKEVILRNSGSFNYDTNLRDRTVNDDAVRFAVKRWGEE